MLPAVTDCKDGVVGEIKPLLRLRVCFLFCGSIKYTKPRELRWPGATPYVDKRWVSNADIFVFFLFIDDVQGLDGQLMVSSISKCLSDVNWAQFFI